MLHSRMSVRLGLLLLAIALLGACGSTATQSPASSPGPTQSPTANPDAALMADLDALWSGPYDAAKVAALYATDAVFHDMVANETSTGLEAVQAKVKDYATQNFKVTTTSAPIRQGDFVATFFKYGAPDALYPGLGVVELKDGKVLNQWVYPAP
jgi:hypothetical protein